MEGAQGREREDVRIDREEWGVKQHRYQWKSLYANNFPFVDLQKLYLFV